MFKKYADDGTAITLGAVGLLALATLAKGGLPKMGSSNKITQILDAYGHQGATRSKYHRKLKSLTPAQLDYVYEQVVR